MSNISSDTSNSSKMAAFTSVLIAVTPLLLITRIAADLDLRDYANLLHLKDEY